MRIIGHLCGSGFGEGMLPRAGLAGLRALFGGRIKSYEGADALNAKYREFVVWNTLLPPGTPRRNWKQTILSDGFVMLRHPDLDKTIEMGNAVANDLHVYAE